MISLENARYNEIDYFHCHLPYREESLYTVIDGARFLWSLCIRWTLNIAIIYSHRALSHHLPKRGGKIHSKIFFIFHIFAILYIVSICTYFMVQSLHNLVFTLIVRVGNKNAWSRKSVVPPIVLGHKHFLAWIHQSSPLITLNWEAISHKERPSRPLLNHCSANRMIIKILEIMVMSG